MTTHSNRPVSRGFSQRLACWLADWSGARPAPASPGRRNATGLADLMVRHDKPGHLPVGASMRWSRTRARLSFGLAMGVRIDGASQRVTAAISAVPAAGAEYSSPRPMPDNLPPTPPAAALMTVPAPALPVAAAAAPAAAPAAPKPKPPPPMLPNTRHMARVPAHIGPAALSRVRNAAYQLPQVIYRGRHAGRPGARACGRSRRAARPPGPRVGFPSSCHFRSFMLSPIQ